MLDKQELSMDELKMVNGGETYKSAEELRFLYGIGYHVEVHTFRLPYIHQFTSGGVITRTGYTCVNGVYSPCYYITCDDDDDSGWYDEDFLQDTTYGSWDKVEAPVTVVE